MQLTSDQVVDKLNTYLTEKMRKMADLVKDEKKSSNPDQTMIDIWTRRYAIYTEIRNELYSLQSQT